jgi:hypothetical protein
MQIHSPSPRAARTASLEAHYATLLASHATSGLSLRSFAARHGLSAWTLYGWRRRLAIKSSNARVSEPQLVAVDVLHDRPTTCMPTIFQVQRTMNTNTEFYLASSEGYELSDPRRCRPLKRMQLGQRDDCMLVSIDPPIIGQRFGLGERNIDTVVIAARHVGDSLFPVGRWPVYVHVARLLVPYNGQSVLKLGDVESIAWAELYQSEESARRKGV